MTDRTTEIIDAIDELVDWQLTLREGAERKRQPVMHLGQSLCGPGTWIRRLLLIGPREAADYFTTGEFYTDPTAWELVYVRARYLSRVRNP